MITIRRRGVVITIRRKRTEAERHARHVDHLATKDRKLEHANKTIAALRLTIRLQRDAIDGLKDDLSDVRARLVNLRAMMAADTSETKR